MTDSLLAHLAGMFATQRYEDLASEALVYLLNRAPALRQAVDAILSTTSKPVEIASAHGQIVDSDSAARPDIELHDTTGTIVALIEAKFDAGLTINQPATYLQMDAGTVLFVIPGRRIESLWPELCRRAATVGSVTAHETHDIDSLRSAAVDGAATLAIISWAELGQRLRTAAVRHAPDVVGEVDQFVSVCARFEADVFVPFTSEELTSDWGRRLLHFHDLTQAIVARVQEEHDWVNTIGLRWSRGDVWYGSYLNIGRLGGGIWFSPRRWPQFGTPFTVQITPGWGSVRTPMPAAMLAPLVGGPADPGQDKEGWHVPLFIPVGAEWDVAVTSMADQVASVIRLIPDDLRTARVE